MSDSEDEFASADEGKVENPSAGSAKARQQETGASVPDVISKLDSKSSAGKGSDKPLSDQASKSHEEKLANKSAGTRNDKKNRTRKFAASGGAAAAQENESKPSGKKGKQENKKGKQKKSASKAQSLNFPGDTPAFETDQNVCEGDKSPVPKCDTTDMERSIQSEVSVSVKGNKSDEFVKTKNEDDSEKVESEKQTDSCVADPDLSVTMEPDAGLVSGDLTLEQKVELIKSPSSQSISRPPSDHTESQEAVLEKLSSNAKENQSGWGWGWGSSLLDVASSSVSTFTNQVGEGFHTVLETVESALDMPNPEELARKDKAPVSLPDHDNDVTDSGKQNAGGDAGGDSEDDPAQKKQHESVTETEKQTEFLSGEGNKETETQSGDGEQKSEFQSSSGWFSAWGVSNITKIVENTSKSLVTGSLDVLETLGKKTFDVINEHDPGLKKARAFLHDRGNKPNLSAILRDAKEKEEVRVQLEKESEQARKAHFGSLFDDFQGLAHLEALEMLSNQCEKKVNMLLNSLSPEMISTLKPQLLVIKKNFEVIEDDDEDIAEQEFDALVIDALRRLNVGNTADKLIKTRQNIEVNFQQCCETSDKSEIEEIHKVAISSLAEFTSKCIEQFHKAGELILIQKSKDYNYVDSSSILQSFTKVLTAETGILSTKFTEFLNTLADDKEIKVNRAVTNIFLEASNSSTYIQDGFQLLLPVIQQAAIECCQESE